MTTMTTIMLSKETRESLKGISLNQFVPLRDYFRRIMEMPEYKVFYELMRIRFAPEKIIEEDKNLSGNGVRPEMVQKILPDLERVYKEVNPDCWLNMDFSFPEKLRESLKDDSTMLYCIRKRVIERLKEEIDLRRLEALLSSEEEKYRYGGLMELHFTKKEAVYLKDVTPIIWEYVKNIDPEEIMEAEVKTPTSEEKFLAFARKLQQKGGDPKKLLEEKL